MGGAVTLRNGQPGADLSHLDEFAGRGLNRWRNFPVFLRVWAIARCHDRNIESAFCLAFLSVRAPTLLIRIVGARRTIVKID